MRVNDAIFIILLTMLVVIGAATGLRLKDALKEKPTVTAQVPLPAARVPDVKPEPEVPMAEEEESEETQSPVGPFSASVREDAGGVVYLNRPIPLSGLTREAVLAHRKAAMKSSIFSDEGYSPSEEVFGAIEDDKPWIAMNLCRDPQTRALRTDGPSEEDRWIGNPSILVAIEYAFTRDGMAPERCTSDVDNLFPQAVSYDADKKEITVEYDSLPFDTVKESSTFYDFNGVNARDLGYKYVYMSGTTVPLMFVNPNHNLFTQVVEFVNFIHVGGSCGVEGGCNNGSPRQPLLEFKAMRTLETNGKSGEIILKLWKERPSSM